MCSTLPVSELAELQTLATSYPPHSDHYYPDGSLVLLVGPADSEAAVKFRIHQGIIVKHSTIFKDMFSIGSPASDDGPVVDGASSTGSSSGGSLTKPPGDIILHLPDDDPKGFQNVLNAVYDPQFLLLTLPRMIHNKEYHQFLTIIDSILVIVDKYHFHSLHEPLSFTLHRIAPISPDAMIQKLQTLPWQDATALSAQRQHCVAIIDLSRKHGIPELLPAAFYTIISICSPKEVYQLESLSWQDRCRCVVAAYEVCLKMTQHAGHAPPRTFTPQMSIQIHGPGPMGPGMPPGGMGVGGPGPIPNHPHPHPHPHPPQPGSLAALAAASTAVASSMLQAQQAPMNQGGINPFWAPRDLGRVPMMAKNATWNALPTVFQLGENWEELRKSSSLRVGVLAVP